MAKAKAKAKSKSNKVYHSHQQLVALTDWFREKGPEYVGSYTGAQLAAHATEALGFICRDNHIYAALRLLSPVDGRVFAPRNSWKRVQAAYDAQLAAAAPRAEAPEKQKILFPPESSPAPVPADAAALVEELRALRRAVEALSASQLAILRELCNSRCEPNPSEEDGVVPSSQPAYQS